MLLHAIITRPTPPNDIWAGRLHPWAVQSAKHRSAAGSWGSRLPTVPTLFGCCGCDAGGTVRLLLGLAMVITAAYCLGMPLHHRVPVAGHIT